MANPEPGKLSDHKPVKLSITITKDLHDDLQAYASLYAATDEIEEPVAALIPALLAAFMDSDRAFTRSRKASQRGRK